MTEDAPPTRVRTREAVGWAMFDFANSSYTTVIVTVVYAVVFPRVIVGDAPAFRHGNFLWSLCLAISYGLVVLLSPVVGALADLRAAKKRALLVSATLTVAATAGLYFAGPSNVALAMGLLIVGNTGFALGESLVASFLPELGPPESLGRLSGYAWGLGYVGGLLSTGMVLATVGPQTADNAERLRMVGPITAAFFAFGSVPTFLLLRERGVARDGSLLDAARDARSRLAGTVRNLGRTPDLGLFLASVFFSMAGLGIVIAFAFVYGDQVIHWAPTTQAAMFALTQVSATAGAIAFGRLQGRLGDLVTFRFTLLIWIAVSLLVPATKSLAGVVGISAEHFFLVVGSLAGLCLGATQSASRTLVSLFSPRGREGEFAGLWGLAGKLAQMTGLLLLGTLQRVLGLERAILLCTAFFVLAFVSSGRVDQARGRATALAAGDGGEEGGRSGSPPLPDR